MLWWKVPEKGEQGSEEVGGPRLCSKEAGK